jgi:GTP-binding protein LepA
MLSVSSTKIDTNALQPYIIPGFQKVKPFVFAGVYPMETDDYDKLKSSFEKLALNDSALVIEHETSAAMGHGFRCGFLGMLSYGYHQGASQ